MKRATASAGPSSANLGHGFDVLAVALESPDLGRDRVTADFARRWEVVVEGPAAEGIPADPVANAAARAARALTRRPLRLVLWKQIAAGSGLGGSGASAAAAAAAVNAILDRPVSGDRLIAAAAEGERASAGAPHRDNVAAAILGGLVCVADAPLSWPVARHVRFAIALPRIEKTTRAMRRVVPKSWPRDLHTREMARAVATAMLLSRGDLASLGALMRDSIVERRRSRLIPGYARVVAAADRAGASAVTLSGAGPTMIAVVDGRRTDPELVAARMAEAFRRAGVTARPATASAGPGARLEDGR